MKNFKFTINERLTDLNEFLKEANTNRYKANKTKKDIQARIRKYIAEEHPEYLQPVALRIIWTEGNHRRDVDNIIFAKKFIFDAMQEVKVIANDNLIKEIKEKVIYEKDTWRVEVEVAPLEEETEKKNTILNTPEEDLLLFAKRLKEMCEGRNNCDGCIANIYNEKTDESYCRLSGCLPCEWWIRKDQKTWKD